MPPSPKAGNAGTLVSPASPKSPKPADDAVPGEAEKQAKLDAANAPPPPPAHKPDPKKKGWIEVAMVGEDGKPITSLAYSITLPDGTLATGTLDDKGVGRVEGFDPGSCQITFPDLDQEAWKPA